jgi:hypothetical protein
MDYNRFKAQLERVPAGQLPEDKRFNPLAMNPYVLYKALPHARRYSTDELIRAMELLLDCNQRLISSTLDESLVLQQTLVQIVRGGGQLAAPAARKITDYSAWCMNALSNNLGVWVGDNLVCVKVAGRANFSGSVDLKTLVSTMWEKGYHHFVLDLTECLLMGQHLSRACSRAWV